MNQRIEFDSFAARVFQLYGEHRYKDALEIAKEAARRFPDQAVETAFWIACLYNRLGESARALDALRDAIKDGIWWSNDWLLGDEDLATLRDRTEFLEVVDHCKRLRAEAEAKARPELLHFTPETDEQILLLAIHGRGGTAQAMAERWKTSAAKLGATLAVPQSTQMFAKDRFCWDDPPKTEAEITAAYANLLDRRTFDRNRTVIAGFSQGANVAILVSLNRKIPSRGFIAIAPGYRELFVANRELLNVQSAEGLRGWMYSGEKDPHFVEAKQLHGLLIEKGANCEFTVDKNLGHDYPPRFDDALKSALDFVLE